MLTIKKLKYFEAISRTKHFGRAAEACSVSQPALSMQIQELEAELGLTLVDRRHNSVNLTPEGEAILERTKKVLLDIDSITEYAKSLSDFAGELRIGMIPTIGPYLLPELLSTIRRDHPDLKPIIRETQTDKLIDELQGGRVELAIAALPVDDIELEIMPLFQDRFLLATSTQKAPPKTSDGLKDYIASEQLLLLEEGHCLRDQAMNHCDVAGIQYGEIFGTSNLSTLVQLVANGLGVTLVPELCLKNELPEKPIRLTRFPEPQPYRDVALIWRKSSPRSRQFEEFGKMIIELHDGLGTN